MAHFRLRFCTQAFSVVRDASEAQLYGPLALSSSAQERAWLR